jgi:surfactin synthase thioesterase subunit
MSLASDPELIAWLRRQGGARPELLEHAELMALALPILRADLSLIDAYHHEPGPPLACGVTALAGAHDALAPPEAMAPWSELTQGPFRLEVFEGDHFFLMQKPAEVTAKIVVALDEALPGRGPWR